MLLNIWKNVFIFFVEFIIVLGTFILVQKLIHKLSQAFRCKMVIITIISPNENGVDKILIDR